MPKISQKGGEFERNVCRALTTWIDSTRTSGKPELFWRSATSGAKATQDRKSGRNANQGGDIIAIQDEVLGTDHFWVTKSFSIECKDRKGYGNLDLILQAKGDFLKWWKQAVDDADKAQKEPLLIFKKRRGEILIAHRGHSTKMATNLPTIMFWEPPYYKQAVVISNFERWLKANKYHGVRSAFIHHQVKHLGKAGQ